MEPGCPGALDEQGLAAFMTDAGAMFGPVFGQVEAGQLQEAVATLIDGSGAAQATLLRNPSSGSKPNWRRPPACPSN